MASDIDETIIGLMQDHSKPIHVHIVSPMQLAVLLVGGYSLHT